MNLVLTLNFLELNRNSENHHAEVERAAFNPASIVPGVGFSSGKMLQSCLFSFGDTQRTRANPSQ